jgi:hypothetical protein
VVIFYLNLDRRNNEIWEIFEVKWQYKLSLFLMILSWTIFLIVALYNTSPILGSDTDSYAGYSWIWYHQDQWIISLVLNIVALALFIVGLLSDIKSGWTISKFIKIEISESENEQ